MKLRLTAAQLARHARKQNIKEVLGILTAKRSIALYGDRAFVDRPRAFQRSKFYMTDHASFSRLIWLDIREKRDRKHDRVTLRYCILYNTMTSILPRRSF